MNHNHHHNQTNQPRESHAGHNKHEGHSTAMFGKKFWVCLALTVPVVLYSDIVKAVFDYTPQVFTGSAYLPAVLGSVVFFYGGWVFLVGAWREIRGKSPGMMTLISLAILAAYLYSVYVVLLGPGEPLFWELTTLITIMLLGHWLEMRAVRGAQGALRELAKLLPDTAEVIRNGETVTVSLSELKEGDVVLVRPGAKVPADGVVVEGESELNESMVTGESKPVAKKKDSDVVAGTVNGDGSLKVKITKIGEKTFLSGVMRLVAEAQASKSKLQLLSDRAAFYLTVIAIVSGVITLTAWLVAKADPSFAMERVIAVLVIACPHALGLAIPLVASISTTLAARNGFLVKQRVSLELARTIKVVLFDKTGTLTKGEYGVDKVIPADGYDEERILRYAASVNSQSEHPAAKAIVNEAKQKNIGILNIQNFRAIRGKGAEAKVEGKSVIVGGRSILEEKKIELKDDFIQQVDLLAGQGKTIIYAIEEDKLLGAIALADVIREESREAIKDLKDMGIKVAMITGDSEEVAKWVSEELGIDMYFARVLPEQKSTIVKGVQEDEIGNVSLRSRKGKLEIGNSRPRRVVAMVGDGINDAPALTRADVGIAIGAGTNVAIESAGIILVRNDPRDIPKIIRLSQASYSKMIQNLFWATGYNVVALPLAAGVLAFKGIILQPALAALLMSLSTVIVAINAVLLRRKKL